MTAHRIGAYSPSRPQRLSVTAQRRRADAAWTVKHVYRQMRGPRAELRAAA